MTPQPIDREPDRDDPDYAEWEQDQHYAAEDHLIAIGENA